MNRPPFFLPSAKQVNKAGLNACLRTFRAASLTMARHISPRLKGTAERAANSNSRGAASPIAATAGVETPFDARQLASFSSLHAEGFTS